MKRTIQRHSTRERPVDRYKLLRSGVFAALLLISTALIAFVDTLVGVGLLGCVVAIFIFIRPRTQTKYEEGQLQDESSTNHVEKVEAGDEYAALARAVSGKSSADLEKKSNRADAAGAS